MKVIPISAFKNKIALVASGGKKSRGRYGDGSVYRAKGRRIFWMAWHEKVRQPNGTVKSQRQYASTGTTDEDEAYRRLRAKLVQIGGLRPTQGNPHKRRYEDLRENFIQYLVMNNSRSLRKDREGNPTLNTLPRLDGFFGGWLAEEIDIASLKRFRIEGKREGLSDARLNRYMATLRKMFNQAVRDELIVNKPSYFPTTHEPNEARGAIYIEAKWYEPLRRVLKGPLRDAFTLAYHTAIRVGELGRVRWRDVDMETQTISLISTHTKIGKQRTIGIPSDLQLKPGKPDELVFPLGDCRQRWRTACVKVGAGFYVCRDCGLRVEKRQCEVHGRLSFKKLVYRGITLRHTRHTAVTNMDKAGISRSQAMKETGHISEKTFERYNIGQANDAAERRRVLDEYHRETQRRLANVSLPITNRSK